MGLEDLFSEIVKAVFAGVVPLIAAGVVWVLVQLARKIGWSISADQQALIKIAAQDLIFRYEEKVAALAKAEIAVPADYKIRSAVKALLEKFPSISEEEARAIIEAELPKVGLGAAAAVKAGREAAATS